MNASNCLSFCISWCLVLLPFVSGTLYPFDSESRETKSLNGLWLFKISPEDGNIGFKDSWFNVRLEQTGDTMTMPVPSSFNDITTNSTVRDFLGWAWYQKAFYAPPSWDLAKNRAFLRFGGVHYLSKVWLNGKLAGEHESGHLPFELEVTDLIVAGRENRLTVAANNVLHKATLPPAQIIQQSTDGNQRPYKIYNMMCDYYNYGGINRPVLLVMKPKVYICNVRVQTGFKGKAGLVRYTVEVCGGKADKCSVRLLDKGSEFVASSEGFDGKIEFDDVQLWWPFMAANHTPGYLYTLEATINSTFGADIYRLPVGIRTVDWTSTSLLINNAPVYLSGVGMHEDSDIRGRGFDNAVLMRDMNLLKWLGVNSFRTSHYPYAEETLNQADELGILVILEAPGCSLDYFGDDLLALHKTFTGEMIAQHKNRPSIIMWSLGNEPRGDLEESSPYFKALVDLAHSLDKYRPVTVVTGQHPLKDKVAQHLDVICVNRYYGWYTSTGRLDLIVSQVLDEFHLWRDKYKKPLVMSEYGAGSLTNLHTLPSSVWSEDYHIEFLLEHFKAFDILRAEGYFIGEMIWNFIDFNVQQEYSRPGKCSKGLFTRNRQPKAASYLVKARYFNLAKGLPLDGSCPSVHVGAREENHAQPIQEISASSSSRSFPASILIISIFINVYCY